MTIKLTGFTAQLYDIKTGEKRIITIKEKRKKKNESDKI
jgi:hypothetical protein